jgi:molecular chaperone DnaK
MIAGGYFRTLIPANSTVPTSATHVFTTVRDDQTAVKIVVQQGDSEIASQNELLGEFLLTGLPKAARGTVEVDVRFDISPDGIVSVSARDRATGVEQSIQVTATNKLGDEELANIMKDNERYAVTEKQHELFGSLRTDAERALRELERLWPTVRDLVGSADFGDDALKKAEQIVERARRAIAMQDLEALKAVREPLERTAVMFKGIVAKMGK